MIERFAKLPRALEEQTKFVRLGAHDVPALVASPDWDAPAPVVLWMHGRTVDKTLDPGRYLRWIRGGVGACAVDLPGHGERLDDAMHSPSKTLYVAEQMIEEIDPIVEALGAEFGGAFDLDRVGIGGMSAGGMAALRRLCEPHGFRCAAVESTIGDLSVMPYADYFPAELIERLDPMRHLDGWRPMPLLALHSEKDEWAPVKGMRGFMERVRERYGVGPDQEVSSDGGTTAGAQRTAQRAVPPSEVQFVTWPETGAPFEHAGFGRVANDAKNLQTAFFRRWLIEAA